MLIYKVTNTLDGYLPPLAYTEHRTLAEVLLVGGKTISLDDFPKLRGIFKSGVGTDNLPFAEASRRKIEIRLPSNHTCDIIFEETAAFTCHLILYGLYIDAGEWERWEKADRESLRQRRLLVIGVGHIGRRVAEKMRVFMNVDTFDSAHDSPDLFEAKVRAADCVSLHIPLTSETRGLFNAERLAWLPDGALLVNTARGAVVNEEALYDELSMGRLRAAMDVFWEEPYRGKLSALPPDRFIRTPHIASTCNSFLHSAATDFLAFMNKLAHS
ncbi:MAG: NAD(P)-dependent oxidoreductase [Nitrospirales bacterium]|nr:NAD(P)-dependent oxidoreductase [Nitrospirales bacterium]